jgi:hypothetical protein
MASQVDGVYYVTGIRWKDNEPSLRVQTDEIPLAVLVEARDLNLRFRTDVEKPGRCVGRIERSADGSSYVECLSASIRGRQCERCQVIDNVSAANMHQAHRKGRDSIDQRMAAYLSYPHRLYVAIFRDGSTKVGTTRGSDGGQRLVEQGAWFAKYVAHVEDGFLVRELEDLISESINLGQAVDTRKKFSGHLQAKQNSDLETTLEGLTFEVAKVLKTQEKDGWALREEAWVNPALNDEHWMDLVAYPAALTHGAHEFTIRSMVGRLAACDRPGFSETFLLDTQPLLGRPLERGDFELDKLVLQESLF